MTVDLTNTTAWRANLLDSCSSCVFTASVHSGGIAKTTAVITGPIFKTSQNNLMNSVNIVNIKKYITVNITTLFISLILRNYQQICNTL